MNNNMDLAVNLVNEIQNRRRIQATSSHEAVQAFLEHETTNYIRIPKSVLRGALFVLCYAAFCAVLCVLGALE